MDKVKGKGKGTKRGLLVAFTLVLSVPVALAQKADDKKPAAPAAAAPAPAAAPAAPPGPPKVAAEMDQLKFFVGKWKCEGKAFANPVLGPEHTFKSTAEAKVEANGHWQHFTYEEKKSKDHPGFKLHGMWGWNAADKRFVRAAIDDMGGWDSATSPGLQGDKILWTGEVSGPMGKMPFHQTFTKKSDKEWSFAVEMKGPDGKWAPWDEVTCKK